MSIATSKPASEPCTDPDCETSSPSLDPAMCQPISTAPLARPAAEHIAKLLKSISDPTRLQLISMIRSAPNGEACVCDLTEPLGLRQPTVSHHLRVLTDAGILAREKRATWVWYSMAPGGMDAVLELLR
ncbi:ArsR/SmtB family transcription factor [Streptomyces sp. NPDC021020]|uniref:ArsR/SmtB family transcription factor n=1 Tax=Streptomyces sp. NPDC021020 TaxID=3365109 RepID=UPI00379183E4